MRSDDISFEAFMGIDEMRYKESLRVEREQIAALDKPRQSNNRKARRAAAAQERKTK